MKKGITPIISIIILLLITISLAGVAYTFLMGQMFGRISGSFQIPIGAAFCTNKLITINIANTGQSDLVTLDFIIAQIDGIDITPYLSSISAPPNEARVLLRAYDCGGNCTSGPHSIDLGTKSMVEHVTVYCQ